jgi:hypothetical protein
MDCLPFAPLQVGFADQAGLAPISTMDRPIELGNAGWLSECAPTLQNRQSNEEVV